ncbi:large conductance mechanosensitive channel protein MscL [Luteolibacter flavescens]|uniref:Large-conductance mechanosensitive channel n=1 Tax=Luteolibacter flavescens TaxID=1859460 RepID=A0ABT3FPZ5_9BACT|nr:large conductance mechanosensitive channel protein MscL [Luteolibacter flavescens]MCW1885389.1 large conductance mechanosensitive channel protein MscL [Luteolibacter flavescens]
MPSELPQNTMLKEFREFILKGNMLDLAVGVIIGASFGKVVTAFTDILLAAIGKVGGQPDFSGFKPEGFPIGVFLNSIISLLIVGFALFIVVKIYNTAKKRFEAPVAPAGPAELPADVKLLTEIRDLLKNKA